MSIQTIGCPEANGGSLPERPQLQPVTEEQDKPVWDFRAALAHYAGQVLSYRTEDLLPNGEPRRFTSEQWRARVLR